jgi:hypothetical protein
MHGGGSYLDVREERWLKEMVEDTKEICSWCKYRQTACDVEDAVSCDFKSLDFEKEAILKRIRDEMVDVMEKQKHIDTMSHKDIFEMMDKVTGVSIMIKVLKEEFKMTDDEIKSKAKIPALSLVAKVKLLAKIKMMERQRAGIPGARTTKKDDVSVNDKKRT